MNTGFLLEKSSPERRAGRMKDFRMAVEFPGLCGVEKTDGAIRTFEG
jgi:hypothetical protein